MWVTTHPAGVSRGGCHTAVLAGWVHTSQLEDDPDNVGQGERYDVLWEARAAGNGWRHRPINHHNDNREERGGGLMLILNVSA